MMMNRKPRPYTPEDDAKLREWYGVISANEIGRRIDRVHSSICHRAKILGLETTNAVRRSHTRQGVYKTRVEDGPTPDVIAERAAAIRSTWTQHEQSRELSEARHGAIRIVDGRGAVSRWS